MLPRKPALYGAGAALLLLVAGCGGVDDADPLPGTVQVWAHRGQPAEVKALQDVVDRINTGTSGVVIDLDLIPEDSYAATLAATPAGALPDVVEVDGPNIASLVYDQKLVPLDDLVAPATLANSLDAVKAQGTIHGQIYGLGQFESGGMMWCDRRKLADVGVQPPRTLRDAWTAQRFGRVLRRLSSADPDGKVLDIQVNNPNFGRELGTFTTSPIVYSAGGALVRNGRAEGALNSPQAVEALTTFASWKRFVDPDKRGDSFVTGRVACSWVGHWAGADYREALGDDLVLLPLPDFGLGTKSGHGSYAWGITANSTRGRAAGLFIDALLSDRAVLDMTAANGSVPGTRSAILQSEYYRPGSRLSLFADVLDQACAEQVGVGCYAVTRPVTAGYPVISAAYSRALKAIYGGADPQTELTRAARAIDEDFAEHGGYLIPCRSNTCS